MPTKIEWAHETVNPITGCTPISAGCKNCYAARMAKRLAGRCGYPESNPFQPGVWHENQIEKMSKIPGKGKRVFVGSMGDMFHPANNLRDILKVLYACFQNTHHQFLLLTKRPDVARRVLPSRKNDTPENIWFGVTVENQKAFSDRIYDLSRVRAKVRFLSVEPMLEPITLTEDVAGYIDWVVCGAETGPGARRMEIKWAESLYAQCRRLGIPFFFKKPSKGDEGKSPVFDTREFPMFCPDCGSGMAKGLIDRYGGEGYRCRECGRVVFSPSQADAVMSSRWSVRNYEIMDLCGDVK